MRRALPILLTGLGLGCASDPPPPPPQMPWLPARLSVEVLRGFDPGQAAAPEATGPVVVLVDSTRSMGGQTAEGLGLAPGARRGAARFIHGLPAQRPVWLYALGAGAPEGCHGPERVARARRADERPPLIDRVWRLRPGGEGGLAAALVQVGADLEAAGTLAGSRVVLFSDLSGDCGGDLCDAAARLVGAGVGLDVVALGDRAAPDCLRDPSALAELGPSAPGAEARIHYRLEVASPEPVVVGCSEVGGPAVAAPAGRGTVVVDLDPPLRVDAFFAAGREHVLEVLEFPALDPPTRHWRWRQGEEAPQADAP